MKRIKATDLPHDPADAASFVLPARMQRLLGADAGEAVRLYRVVFDEGARTNWHAHDATQLLFSLSGRCIVVDRAGDRRELEPGDLVVIDRGANTGTARPPGEPASISRSIPVSVPPGSSHLRERSQAILREWHGPVEASRPAGFPAPWPSSRWRAPPLWAG
jgi:quercetin dioxygenase-like cupin family protein